MLKAFIYAGIIVLFSGILVLSNDADNSTLVDFSINVLAAAFLVSLDFVVENWSHFWLVIVTNTWYRNKTIRISISYLFRIKIEGKYLLIRGNRIPNQFQPVGGVYKRFNESNYQLQDLQVTDDNNIPIDETSQRDLRVKMPATSVRLFIKWFNSQRGREVSVTREFHEELITTGILTMRNFPYPNYMFLKRHQTSIRFSPYFRCYEILIADLFELQPDQDQINELKATMLLQNDKYEWVTEERIKNLGALPGGTSTYTISEPATWLLS